MKEDIIGLTKEEKELLKVIKTGSSRNKSKTTILPKKSGITVDMIPKYCYYKQPNKCGGDGFCIDRKHPKMNGKRWQTSTSKKISLKDKYDKLIEKLKELEEQEEQEV